MTSLRISVIVPTWKEAGSIAACVASVRAFASEVIVVDAGGDDETAVIAERAGARVLAATTKGRGPQLHQGALAASGDVLLFLHADVEIGSGAAVAIERALADGAIVGGNFYLRFVPTSRAARLFTWANHVRRRWMRIYYGDSGIFVRRGVYVELGGFRSMPIMEDYELVRRLERRGRTAYVTDVEVHASARRFAGRPIRTLVIWTLLQSLFILGVRPARLARLYADLR